MGRVFSNGPALVAQDLGTSDSLVVKIIFVLLLLVFFSIQHALSIIAHYWDPCYFDRPS